MLFRSEFVPFSPLGRGYLTGKIQSLAELAESDFRQHDPRFVGENFQKNLRILEVVKQIATETAAAPSQIALAWLSYQGNDVVPIPGTKRMQYLEENIAATRVQLTPAQLDRLNSLAQITSGPRYNEMNMTRVER